MRSLEDKIVDLIDAAVVAAGFELVRVKLLGDASNTLQIMAERSDKTMSAKDCARLSRVVSPVLEETDPIAGAYTLEVSSPGIDRPLTRLKDYHDWQGFEAKIELNRLVEGRKRFRGVLAGVEKENIVLDIEGEETSATIPFAWIDSGKLLLSDALIKESLKAAEIAAVEEKTNDHHNGDA